MPYITFRVFLNNKTKFNLLLIDSNLDHGEWTSGDWEPKQIISAFDLGGIQTESGGIMTGVEGHVVYEIEDTAHANNTRIYIRFDNPFSGDPKTDAYFQVLTNGSWVDSSSCDHYTLESTGLFDYYNNESGQPYPPNNPPSPAPSTPSPSDCHQASGFGGFPGEVICTPSTAGVHTLDRFHVICTYTLKPK
ncbi:hypothetical protein FKQ51_19975 [Bacillus toyonensis]|uniref:hypothetical protein n=1 Tax=Bacillus toyonensis TaxID=155322 RepID=UPI00270D702D|nr:hypothetical protein [Bacillus toyonensis]MDO8159590.1 hypothetical protein [Bacillus toyonensis]